MMAIFWALGIRIRVCVTSTAEASWIRSARVCGCLDADSGVERQEWDAVVGGGEVGADVSDEEGLGGVGKLAG